jgi:prepilin-type N-terminal cleavage/methylation domain-containing protein
MSGNFTSRIFRLGTRGSRLGAEGRGWSFSSRTPNPAGTPAGIPARTPRRRRGGFTLTELMIVIMIIGIMAGLALSAISAAAELAREQRTRAIIAKLDQLIIDKYESYRTRAVPLQASLRRPAPNDQTPQRTASMTRLTGIRELMRLELPDRISDLCNLNELGDLGAATSDGNFYLDFPNFTNQVNTSVIKSIPSVTRAYKRHVQRVVNYERSRRPAGTYNGWSVQYQGSECLYLILSQIHDGDKQATDYFAPEEIGDLDDDGMKEILDGWGQPIEFLRWAPGYVTNPWDNNRAPMATTQTRPAIDANGIVMVYTPDIFDPARVDNRVSTNTDITDDPFELRPLIISGGRDKQIGLILEDYSNVNDPSSINPRNNIAFFNDPYAVLPSPFQANQQLRRIGEPFPPTVSTAYADNLTNHFQETQ